jgi:septal ring factor EnvC (AmiA/AmiB activator)
MSDWLNHLLDRWSVLTFIAGAVFAAIWGRATRAAKAEMLAREVAQLRADVADMQGRIARGDTQFAVLTAEIGFIKASISRIEQHIMSMKG